MLNITMDTKTKPTLQGKTILLRPIVKEDTPFMLESTQDEEGNRLTGTQQTFTKEQIEAWCESLATKEGRVDCAIVSKETGEYLGEVVLNQIDELNRSANFRIALRGDKYYGKGIGTEAARLMLEYGFNVLELHRIDLEVFAFNPRAIRVYEKLGFVREGVRREVLFMDGQYHDAIVMGLLRHEFTQ
jgi:RimJ/RimL family protein N-acetyltransferase